MHMHAKSEKLIPLRFAVSMAASLRFLGIQVVAAVAFPSARKSWISGALTSLRTSSLYLTFTPIVLHEQCNTWKYTLERLGSIANAIGQANPGAFPTVF